MIRAHRFFLLMIGFGFTLSALGGCEAIVHSETKLTNNRVQVEESKLFEDIPVTELDDAYIAALSKHYSRYGDGGVDLSITYDPHSKTNSAMKASDTLARVSKTFERNGVDLASANILPVQGSSNVARALISYQSYNAAAPVDCENLMPGMEHRNIEAEEDYKLGCTVETVFARQIARPKDLQGQAQESLTSDGRRASNIVDGYRTGIPNESLEGESSTGEE